MKLTIASIVLSACALMCPWLASAQGKNETRTGKEVYTGTLINMSGGSASTGFTLTIEARTKVMGVRRRN